VKRILRKTPAGYPPTVLHTANQKAPGTLIIMGTSHYSLFKIIITYHFRTDCYRIRQYL